VETVRRIYDEWAAGNFRAGTELFDRYVMLVMRPEFPDAGTYLGATAIGGYMREFLSGWSRVTITAGELLDAGDTVLAEVHQQGTGTSSGAPVDMNYWQAWTFRGESIVRLESIRTRAEAFAAVGL
jgi:ketosteroid isomerase-like protein